MLIIFFILKNAPKQKLRGCIWSFKVYVCYILKYNVQNRNFIATDINRKLKSCRKPLRKARRYVEILLSVYLRHIKSFANTLETKRTATILPPINIY